MNAECRVDRPPSDADQTPWVPAHATRVTEILQTVLTGLILAFIFRAFLVEPFIIPTGSMADTLLGAHATHVCPACGWQFSFAPLRTAGAMTATFVVPPEIVCPNCQLTIDMSAATIAPKAGDRILVHKWPYFLGGALGPRRWDVIVFRDPADADQHYIKRLIGLPRETVEIVGGDIFIDGRIARKPADVQQVLWFVVFDQAHAANPAEPSGREPRWAAADTETDGAGWSGMDTRVIRYDGLDPLPRALRFVPDSAREYLRDFYAYDRRSSGALVGDVRITCDLTLEAGDGVCQWELSRPPYRFVAELHRDGMLQLILKDIQPGGRVVRLTAQPRPPFRLGQPIAVEFGHVDYRVYLKIDGREVLTTTDAEYSPQLEMLRNPPRTYPVDLGLAAQDLRLELRRLRIDRDVYYVCRPGYAERACAGNPFALQAREYFVLGDNSPDSHDSREWDEHGPHLPADYRPGTVREDQIVGAAAFVYLPGLLPLDEGRRCCVPDIGRVRFVR
jgi:signal peptidase I